MSKRQLIEEAASTFTKDLTDKGKLIEAGFVVFAHYVISKDAPPGQLVEMRLAFMAGAEHVFSSIMNIMDPGEEPTAADMRRMELIQNEIDEWRGKAVRTDEPGPRESLMAYDSTADTLTHIRRVQALLGKLARDLMQRGEVHDASKLGPEEKPLFDEMTPLLKSLTYGTDEYKASLARLGAALKHHYAENSHHPEHYDGGVGDMTLLDVVEMFCDWKAASERTKDGDFQKSIEIGIERFKIEPQLASIMRNSIVAVA